MSTTCFPLGEKPKGKTEFERFDDVMKRILSVPKKKTRKATTRTKKNAPGQQ